ncbi:LemA family protein [Candidatus Roizmanbacteria bacterium]|nr:LemA family protein [Candidatus Roizmanbacteria bacterium]
MSLFQALLWSAGIAAAILVFLWRRYNSFIAKRNQVKTDFADIDVQLKRRASLIENLVEIVREYAKHEKGTFTEVTKARLALEKPHGPKESQEIENMLTSTLRSLFAVSENYPKLQASENYKQLQDDLKQTENAIAHYRETYNQSVLDFNTAIQTFPNLLAAALFGFEEEELFEPGLKGRAEITIKAQ